MFENTIDGVNMVENERKTSQSGNVRELSFLVSVMLISNFGKLEVFSSFPLISR